MKLPKKLYKTTIVIWSEEDPSHLELEDLARDATSGDSYCSKQELARVDPLSDPDWDGTEFFGEYPDDEDDDDENS